MTQLPTGRRGRQLALGVTLLGVLVLWLGVVSPALGWYAERDEALQARRALAARMEGLAATLPRLRQQAASGAASAPPVAVLDGATDAIAGATLQEMTQAMARRAGANLNSLETLPAETRAQYRRIALRISVSAEWPVLVRLLAEIERATPPMLIDDLQLRGQSMRLRIPTQAAAAPPVEASLTIVAFRAGDAAPSGTAPLTQ